MANNAGKDKVKKSNIDEKAEFLDEEESNKKAIILLILFIFIVLGLIFGSIYYFNNKGKEEPKDDGEENTPVEVVPMPDKEDDTIEEDKEDEETTESNTTISGTTNTVANNSSSEEEEIIEITVIFYDENGRQIGKKQVITDPNELEVPELPEKDGYESYWKEACNESTRVCTFTVKYSQILVSSTSDDYSATQNGKIIELSGLVDETSSDYYDTFGNTGRKIITLEFVIPDEYDKDVATQKGFLSITTSSSTSTENFSQSPYWDADNGKIIIELAVDDEENLPTINIDWDGDTSTDEGKEAEYEIDVTNLETNSYASQLGISTTTGAEQTSTGTGKPSYEVNATENSTNNNTISVNGEVNNYETKTGQMQNMGFANDEKNILVLKFTAPEGLTNFDDLKVTTEEGTYTGASILDGDNYFYLYQAVDPGTTSNPTIKIDWDGAGTTYDEETYVIDTDTIRLTPDEELDATVETPSSESTNQNLVQNHDGENIIEVEGEISYNESESRHEITTTFKPIEGTTTGTSIKVNGTLVTDESKLTKDTDGKVTSYTHTEEITQNEVDGTDPAPTVEIDWNADDGVDVTYEYDLTDATLETPPTP